MSSKNQFPISSRQATMSRLILALFLVGSATRLFADVKLPALFSDNMVLQQNVRLPVWGWADEGEQVTVSFRNIKATAIAKAGKWQVTIGSFKAGGPDQLAVSGKNTITLTNVMVGEVWVCSGQS